MVAKINVGSSLYGVLYPVGYERVAGMGKN